jgi:hypothetical protein
MNTIGKIVIALLSIVVVSSAAFAQIASNGSGGGAWSSTATWSGGVVPTSGDVTIANGDVVTIDQAVTIANLTVGQGASGTLTFDGAAARSVSVSGNVTIATGGTFITQSTGTFTNTLSIGGNLTNSGTFDMSRGGTTFVCTVTFNKNGNQTVSGTGGTTRFNNITLNMGTSNANVLEISSSNFSAPSAGFVTFTNGTLKLSGSYTLASKFFTSTSYSIPSTCGFWLNNSTVTVTGQGASPTNNGLIRITSGTYNMGTSSGNEMGNTATAQFKMEGGTFNASGRLKFSNSGGTFNMSNGTINITTVGNASGTTPGFNVVAGASFTWSGGVMNLVQVNTAAGGDYKNLCGSPSISGGTLNIGTSATATNFTFAVQGAMPNTVLDNTTNNKSASLLGNGNVYGNLTLNGTGTFTVGANILFLQNPIAGTSGNLSAGSTSSIVITGSASGINIPSSVTALSNLTLDNTNGTVLQGLLTLSGTLALTSGTLTGSAANLTLGNGATISRSGGLLDAAPLLFTGGTNLIYTPSAGLITTGFEKPAAVNNLTINNALGVTLGAPLVTVSGTVTLTSGLLSGCTANLTLGSGATISRSGGSLDAAPTGLGVNTNVIYTAPTPPASITTGFELPAAPVNNLTINNASGVTLNVNAAANGTFTLTSGNLTTTNTNLLTLGSGASVVGGSASSFVSGPMANTWSTATATKTYPLGKGSTYRPLAISLTTPASPIIRAEVFNANAGGSTGSLNAISVVRYYQTSQISGTGALGGTAQITFGSDDGVTGGQEANLVVAQSTTQGGTYATLGQSANSATTVTSNSYDPAGGDFLILGSTSGNLLPVEMTSFALAAKRLNVDLRWSTASEVNNFGFEIERKNSTSAWIKIGFVSGVGTSTSLHTYTYTDNVEQAGLYQYRVKQIDQNGSFKYSATMQVEVGSVPKVLSLGPNYPNPFNPTTSIEFSVPTDGRAALKVYNMLGQEVAMLFDGEATAGKMMKVTFDASRLASGVYFSRLDMGGHALVNRMVLMK